MGDTTINRWRVWSALCLFVLAAWTSGSAVSAEKDPPVRLTIESYTLEKTKALGHDRYEATYRVKIRNNGPALKRVRAHLRHSPQGVTANRVLLFGNVAANTSVTSKNTFVLRYKGKYTFKASDYKWTFRYRIVRPNDNHPPLANAGEDQTAAVGVTVPLSGSGSSDPDGDPLSFAWSFAEVPEGSTAAIDAPTTVDPSFVVDRKGTYRVQLVVNDGKVNSAPDVVNINSENSPPVAHPGADQTAAVGATVQLDGSGSTDVDGDELSYQWRVVSVPSGSQAALSDDSIVMPAFRVDRAGVYVFELVVNDGTVASAPATVQVTTANSAPVANAGADQTTPLGSRAQLDGSASSDIDGDPLMYNWSMTSKPAGSAAQLSDTQVVNPSFVADTPGTYVGQLIVNDGNVDSAADTVVVSTENSRPVAHPGVDQVNFIGRPVTLDGAASRDADGDTLSYEWALLTAPQGSVVQLSSFTTQTTQLTPDVAGVYVVQLIVSDGKAASEPVTVNVAAAAVRELTPSSALPGSPEVRVRILGDQLQSGFAIYFDDQAIPTEWISATELQGRVPASLLTASRTFDVTVRAGSAVSSALRFSVVNPAPVLTGVAPSRLLANGQPQDITVTGLNFISGSQIYFGDQALDTTFAAADTLRATIPGARLQQAGTVPVTVFTPAPGGGISAAVTVVIGGDAPVISELSPSHGSAGTVLTIRGDHFDGLNGGGNDVRINGERAVVVKATATQLDVIVPVRATSGLVTVATAQGTATSAAAFTVDVLQNFDIQLATAEIQLPPSGSGSTRIHLNSTGVQPYAQGVNLRVTGMPPGVTFDIDRSHLYSEHDVTINFRSNGTVAAGTYQITVEGTGAVDGTPQLRSKPVTLTVLPAGTTSVSGRVVHTKDDTPFAGARIRLGSAETITDAAGYYRFVSPAVTGEQVVLIDGHTANHDHIAYPSAIPMPVVVAPGQDNRVLTAYLQGIDTREFTPLVPGAETHVTVEELPNYELRIPSGAVLTGWDGKPIDKVNVRVVPADRLPIKPVPAGLNPKSVYLYYFFREGGANPSRPIPVTMNNDVGALPGETLDLWYYDESPTADPDSNQWRKMGTGTVTQDGKSVVSDPGVGIPKFCCGASFVSNPDPDPPPTTCPVRGNPVSLPSGAATVIEPNAFGLQGGRLPVRLSCGYSSVNPTVGFFGRGTYFNYDWRARRTGSQAIIVISPNGERHNLVLEGDGVYRAREGRSSGIGLEATITLDGIVVRHPDGSRMEFATAGLLTAMQDTNGNRVAIARDTNNYATRLTDATGKTYTFETTIVTIGRARYTLVTKITDPVGRSQQYSYDTLARLTSFTDAAGNITRYEYDTNNLIVKKIDPRGAETRYEYDSAGRTLREILPEGGTFEFQYGLAGSTIMETRVTDPNGNTTTYRFNGLGYVTRVIDALGRETREEIDFVTNQVLAETNPAGRTTRYTYDERGNVTSIVDPEGNTTLIEYDARWNKLTQLTNTLGHRMTLQYDERGNPTRLINPEGESVALTYNAAGDLESVTDGLGHVHRARHDESGNVIEIKDSLSHTTRAHYDTARRLIRITNPRGRSTQYQYDDLDRITEWTDALGGITKMAYDAQSNLLSVTDANGHTIETNAYDLRNRLTQRSDAHNKNERYEYDLNGNVIRKTDRKNQVTHYEYDALDRLIRVTDHDGRVTGAMYDLAGNLVRISDSQTGDVVMTYDRLDRLTSVVTNQGKVSYRYDVLGRLTERALNDGDITTYGYDKANRIKTIAYRGQTVTYDYDGAGRLQRKTLPHDVVQQFVYDDAKKVTAIRFEKSGAVLKDIRYEHDANGNRTRKTLQGKLLADTPFTATYDAANRMLTFNGDPLEYDDNGNLIRRRSSAGDTVYTWDAMDRMIEINGPNGSARFSYDAFGRRIGKTFNGTTIQYLYDGEQSLAEMTGGAISVTYLTGLQIDEMLARYTDAGERVYLTDALGTVLALVANDGDVRTEYGYSPFGETIAAGDADVNSVQYTARENDDTGLYYYRARYYDPGLKRFIGTDPIGLASGNVNFYAYGAGNPQMFSDPRGTLIMPMPSGKKDNSRGGSKSGPPKPYPKRWKPDPAGIICDGYERLMGTVEDQEARIDRHYHDRIEQINYFSDRAITNCMSMSSICKINECYDREQAWRRQQVEQELNDWKKASQDLQGWKRRMFEEICEAYDIFSKIKDIFD